MCKVLIVDDDKGVRQELTKIMNDLFPEHEVHGYPATQEALDLALTADDVDIVIFNSLKKNKPDGFTFATKLREGCPSLILIYIMQKDGNLDNLKKLASVGIDGHARRPFDPAMIYFVVTNGLSRANSINGFKSKVHLQLEKSMATLEKKIDAALPPSKERRLFTWRT